MNIKRFALFCSAVCTMTAHAAMDKVGVTIYNSADPFVTAMSESLRKAVQKQGSIELLIYDSKNSQTQQNAQIDALLAQGVKVLVINLVDPAAGQMIADKAKEANIPVVFFNKDPGRRVIYSYDRAYYIGAEPVQSAMIQGDLIANDWKKNPDWDKNKDGVLQFVLLRGEDGHPDAEARSEWVIKELLQKNVQTEKVADAAADWSEKKGQAIMKKWLLGAEGSKIEVVISNNDTMAIGALEAIKSQGRYLPVYGVDAIPEAIKRIEAGEMQGSVLNDGTSQAMAIAQVLPNLIFGNRPDEYTGYSFSDNYLRIPYIGIQRDNLREIFHRER